MDGQPPLHSMCLGRSRTPYVYDVAEQIKKYECGFIYKSEIVLDELVIYVTKEAGRSIPESLSVEIIQVSSFKNRLKGFVDFLINY